MNSRRFITPAFILPQFTLVLPKLELSGCQMAQIIKSQGGSIDDVVDSYYRFLARNNYAGHLKRFKDRLKSDQRAAEAEAAVFCLLWNERLRPDVNEDLSTGGPDFRCDPVSHNPFLVEVTSLDSDSLSEKSALPRTLNGSGAQAYGLVTAKLRSAVQAKATQLGGQPLPSVLAITSSYDFAGLLMDSHAAQNLLVSDPHFRLPIGGSKDSAYWSSDFKNAVFCRPSILDASGEQMFTLCCQSVSAIFLITIYAKETSVVGILHPEPKRLFNPASFPKIPYVRFKHWPFLGGKAQTEWILGKAGIDCARFRHERIR